MDTSNVKRSHEDITNKVEETCKKRQKVQIKENQDILSTGKVYKFVPEKKIDPSTEFKSRIFDETINICEFEIQRIR